MAFSDFKNSIETSRKYGVTIKKDKFLPKEILELPDWFLEEMDYSLERLKPNSSEIAISENLIAPMIRLVVRRHLKLMVWSREYELNVDEDLCGKPDYLISYTADPKVITMDMPLICVAEAKVEKFAEAWGQTLAEMIACQKLYPEFTIYGWITNGDNWQFGKLENDIFTQHSVSFSIGTNAEQIAGILDWIFADAVRQAEHYLNK